MNNFTKIKIFALLLGIFSMITAEAQLDELACTKVHQQDGITISYSAGSCGNHYTLLLKVETRNPGAALAEIRLVKEENGHMVSVSPFHLDIAANSSKVMDYKYLGQHGMMPLVSKNWGLLQTLYCVF